MVLIQVSQPTECATHLTGKELQTYGSLHKWLQLLTIFSLHILTTIIRLVDLELCKVTINNSFYTNKINHCKYLCNRCIFYRKCNFLPPFSFWLNFLANGVIQWMISLGSNFLFQYLTFFYPFSDYHFYVRIQEKRVVVSRNLL